MFRSLWRSLPAVAVAGMWLLGYLAVPWVSSGNWSGGPRLGAGVSEGMVVIQVWRSCSTPAAPTVSVHPPGGLQPPGSSWWFHHEVSWVMGGVWWIPFWILLLPLGAWVGYWRFRRQPGGTCRSCGYCLSGYISGVCPECGSSTRLQ